MHRSISLPKIVTRPPLPEAIFGAQDTPLEPENSTPISQADLIQSTNINNELISNLDTKTSEGTKGGTTRAMRRVSRSESFTNSKRDFDSQKSLNKPPKSIDNQVTDGKVLETQICDILGETQGLKNIKDDLKRADSKKKKVKKDQKQSRRKTKIPLDSENQSPTSKETSESASKVKGSPKKKKLEKLPPNIKDSEDIRKSESDPVPIDSPLFEHIGVQPSHFADHVFQITIHRTDSLVPHAFLKHPMIQIHLVDKNSGKYILKSDPSRPVTRFNEPSYIDYILPTITNSFDLQAHNTKTPIWEDTIVLNDLYLNLVNPNTLILFEIVDFVTHLKKKQTGNPWHRVCWGFLKLVGDNGRSNTEKELRLQLFHYPKKFIPDNDQIPGVFNAWKKIRQKYPSTL